MSAFDQDTPLVFTPDELDMLARTADALSAYMGKPVLAEVVNADETGFEWALFAVPLETNEDIGELVTVQLGGPGSRILGNKGGLELEKNDVYQCKYLWAIQLSDIEGVRFIKVDEEGDEVAWSDDLSTMLPFALGNEPTPPDDEADDDLDDSLGQQTSGRPPTLH